jgi:hypothetical protein
MNRLSHQMSMAHLTKCQIIMVNLTKCQIIMVNLTKGQIRMVNLIKPYPFNMAILMDICPFSPNLGLDI